MNSAPPTPKGFRDIQPEMAKRRRELINTIASTLEEYEFVPIETPTLEFADTLKGKYGAEEKLIYEFEDRGGRKLALRYDLTVPFARYVATYNPPLPFRRYQVGNVFRGENPQKGRYREFTQFDLDTVGTTDPTEDAKVVGVSIKCMRQLGLNNAIMLINDRANFKDFPVEVIRAIDKINKIGEEGVIKELVEGGIPENQARGSVDKIRNQKPTENLNQIFQILKDEYKLEEGKDFSFDPSLARGLDYYTGAIFELKLDQNPDSLSVGGGGRYDNLIGMFAKKSIPAVGFSFGLDRMLEILYS
ncbi:histidine--tRNA ligase [Candidatus Daviesbacteria bacterium RIFCSPHIGHO2_02_FULL_36_13]|uniref:Histidine--tRNA ligase n=1 Tax=Candidatus Daviesbacteria bacterium RIFCSPHIGHO2_02_FULL_36_13 TaxID=1797768 RepID=A0A1F5JQ50_9BACT|nr:MAG: histidine--tRNA ligase [Candidatus Daviesbacteria bacterium RIFCSPHIGHO2_02_FULL_36_13]OGE41651.1 MAG: histidine--tRNA ligase [Candidatus Daviesbacteria bacterium RIFCSPLOWO2_01_FULL_36_8]